MIKVKEAGPEEYDERDSHMIAPARGCVIGILVSLAVWGLIFLAIQLVL